ncbi:hypothetical protein [Bacillus sp. 3a]|uniref:hypothetical protein n=1 Tax=Bacillus sp. 3a TaxID=580459 RepID=UPI001F49E4C0|nr:hypothetical protein [Bacillus sp. 3a]
MFRELDILLSADTTVDSWYDDGCLIASEILSDFSLNDWEELSNQVLNKPIEWQRKIAYCLDNECNEYELIILIDLLNTNDKELFEICIDTLRSFPIEGIEASSNFNTCKSCNGYYYEFPSKSSSSRLSFKNEFKLVHF